MEEKKGFFASQRNRSIVFFLLLGSIFWMLLSGDDKSTTSELPPTRSELIERQFSAWDGSHRGFERIIKKSMNDPDSYEHVETSFKDEGSTLLVVTKFRGTNAFGGKVVNSMMARVDFKGNVIEVVE
jgi:hypothetical protein